MNGFLTGHPPTPSTNLGFDGMEREAWKDTGTDSEGFFDTQLLLGAKVSCVEEKEWESGTHQRLEDRAAMLPVCMTELRG